MPMMLMTTRSSTSVNACRRHRISSPWLGQKQAWRINGGQRERSGLGVSISERHQTNTSFCGVKKETEIFLTEAIERRSGVRRDLLLAGPFDFERG